MAYLVHAVSVLAAVQSQWYLLNVCITSTPIYHRQINACCVTPQWTSI